MEYNIYRLKGGLTPKSWQLPLQDTYAKKLIETASGKQEVFKRMKYIPGTNSIFEEDNKGDLQPQTKWFLNGVLKVRKDDWLKNQILENHPWLNLKYELWSQDIEDTNMLQLLRFKSEARQLIDDSDPNKIQAIALAVFEMSAALWTPEKAELELRKYADEDPKELHRVMNESDYESKLVAGLAFTKGLVKENDNKSKVVWCDSNGEILKLAKGERGILELGRFLSQRNDDSEMVMQSIGDRLEAIDTNTTPEDVNKLLSEKDKEIEMLKAQLKQQDKKEEVDDALATARKAYQDTFGKKVPVNKKNNIDWINNRLGKA